MTFALIVHRPVVRRLVRWCCLGLLTVAGLLTGSAAYALNGQLELSSGYRDNVLESADKQGSAFIRYQLELYQPLYEGELNYLEGYGRTHYHDYTALDDNYEVMAGLAWQRQLCGGALYSLVYAEGNSYRDRLQPEEDYRAIEVGWQLDYYHTEQWHWMVAGTYRGSDFRQDTSARWLNQQPQQPQRPQGPGDGTGRNNRERDDQLWGVLGGVGYHWNADLVSTLKLFWHDNDSSLHKELYEEFGVEHSWQWQLTRRVDGELWGSWSERQYEDSDDRQWLVGVRGNWHLDERLTLFIQLEQQWHRSDFKQDDYNEKVGQCAIAWSF